MKLLLLDVTLSAEQEHALADRGLEVSHQFEESLDSPQIVATYFSSNWAKIEAIRQKYPHSWFCLFYQKGSSPHEEHQQVLTRLGELGVNELWDEEHWIDTLAFSLGCARHFAVHALATEMLISTQHALERLEKNVALASSIHRELLPISFASFPGIGLSAKFVPSPSGLGGNYFDVFELGDKKRLGILLADSPTHGLAAALLSILVKLDAETIRSQYASAKHFVEYLVGQLAASLGTTKPVDLAYAVFDRTTFTLEIASRGTIGIVVRNADNVTVARFPAKEDIHTTSYSLTPNSWVVFATDGWKPVIAMDANDWKEKLKHWMQAPGEPDPVALQQELMGLVDRYREQDDLPEDLTCVQLHIDKRALFVAKKN